MNPLLSSYTEMVGQGRSLAAHRRALERLNQLKLRLHFSHVPTGWLAALPAVDASETWAEAGLKLSGVSYSTIGALVEGTHTSARYWPTSPFYQARLGGFLIQSDDPGNFKALDLPRLESLIQVLVVEQQTWLQGYGCPEKLARPASLEVEILQEINHQDFPAWMCRGSLASCSDVGADNHQPSQYLRYRTYELMFARFGGLHLPAMCTRPPIWPLASYHDLVLDWAGLVVAIPRHHQWILLYCCGARWAGRDYFSIIQESALFALQQARIVSA